MPSTRTLVIAPLLVLAACSDGSGSSGTGGSTSTTSASVCAADSGAIDYAVGVGAAADDGNVKITFADADPAPPGKGNNVFTVDVTDGVDQPLTGADITVKACMPLHGHCASVTPTVTADAKAGRYVVTNVDLFMSGLWTITFTVTPSGGAADPVNISFCVEG